MLAVGIDDEGRERDRLRPLAKTAHLVGIKSRADFGAGFRHAEFEKRDVNRTNGWRENPENPMEIDTADMQRS
jgi:hypothetical protein